MKVDKSQEEVRKVLNVPKELRIAQYIYNIFRDYEKELSVTLVEKGKFVDRECRGIDIFYVGDAEFIKKIKKGL